jgi:hypothetical protein
MWQRGACVMPKQNKPGSWIGFGSELTPVGLGVGGRMRACVRDLFPRAIAKPTGGDRPGPPRPAGVLLLPVVVPGRQLSTLVLLSKEL